jgi:hypothetical protein
MKWCIIDARLPKAAKDRLRADYQVLDFRSKDKVYEAISGHPDIFMCAVNDKLIVAPNLPKKYFNWLKEQDINYRVGRNKLGAKYPQTAFYNVACGDGIFIHKEGITDSTLAEELKGFRFIHTNQAYSRCNTLILDAGHIITSDAGLHKSLPDSLFVNPKEILLPGFINGFFGGCCGIDDKKVLLTGSLKQHSRGKEIRAFIEEAGFELIELYDGPLFDGGGIFIVESPD